MVKEKVRSTIFCKLAALGRQLTAAPSPADPDQSLVCHLGQNASDFLLGSGDKSIPRQLQQPLPADGLSGL